MTPNERIATLIKHAVSKQTGVPTSQISVEFDRRDSHLWKARRRSSGIRITVSAGPERADFTDIISRVANATGTLAGGSLTDQIGVRKGAASA